MAKQSELDVVLNPRPYELDAGRLLLVPLLPQSPPKVALPSEIWERILAYAVHSPYNVDQSKRRLTRAQWRAELSTICRTFSVLVPPLLFAHPVVSTPRSLTALSNAIHAGHARWDSLRRILYSTPGRWVQSLDLSPLDPGSEHLVVDALLRNMLPLVPFLDELRLNPTIQLSRLTFDAFRSGPHASKLRSLTGLRFSAPHLGPAAPPGSGAAAQAMYEEVQDPVLRLLRACLSLQELELLPPPRPLNAADDDDDDWPIPEGSETELHEPPDLPSLQSLAVFLSPTSPMVALLSRSALPSIQRLTIPGELAVSSDLLSAHGSALRALAIHEPPTVSPALAAEHVPHNLLSTCPSLRHLVLPCSTPQFDSVTRHPLATLSIPRPTPEFLRTLERGLFPALRVVQFRDTRWLRKGVAPIARQTGVAGEMARWRVRLGRLRVRVLDGAGREEEV
ncbi:hypothetical protein EXIGLDRAFT_629514 [Exidia glandulosa HHB12029]|uniref:F-box domain-containing protein n=1 Tax=Exidia glandulosa HHB12029 TaxID=1314781 RepID=A0A165BLE9_EXIGL|nr:hypothetical protein EXIGLDRAFT_629514 [Exidia glandulosa HHB12029]